MDGSGKLFLPRPLNSRSWEDGENGLKRSRDNSTEDVDDSTLFHTFLGTSPDDGDNHAYSSPLRSPTTVSSDQDDRAGPERDARTPPRALSNNSLFGEDFVNSSRRSGLNGRGGFDTEDTDHILTLSPEQQPRLPFYDLSPSETMTPPSASHSQTLSPPPLIQHLENVSYSSRTTSQINHSSNNNNSHRPPRAPGQIARFSSHSVEGTVTSAFAAHLSKPPVVLPRHHRRASSAGDASFLSALTDASFEAPNGNDLLLPRGDFTKQQHQEDRRLGHRRNASWDPTVESQLHGEVRGMNIDVPVALQQPILSDFSLQMDQARIPDKSAAMNPVVKKSLMTLVKRSPTVSLAPLDHSNASIAALDNLTAQSSTPSETSSLPATRKALDYEEDHFRAKEIDAKVEKLIFDTHEGHIQRLTMFDSNQAKNPKVLREDALLRASSAFEAFQKTISADDEADCFEVETGHELRLNESSLDMLVRHARIMKSVLVLAYPAMGGASAVIASGKTSRLQRGKEEESNVTNQDTQDQQESDQGNSSVAQDETGHKINHLSTKNYVGLSNEFVRNAKAVEDQWAMFESLCNGEKDSLKRTTLNLVFYAILPSTIIACFLFYGAGNPQAGWWQPGEPAVDPKGDLNGTTVTSASWWCLFLGVRQIVLYALASCFEVCLVKYLALASPGFIRSLGPNLALSISQGHGYPIKLVSFATLSCLLSYGKSDFKSHWLFW
jgi:hypothetical protein